MRSIHVDEISRNIKEMCIEANYYLSDDMKNALYKAADQEENPLGCQILNQLKENLAIAGEEQIPICQDTGMAVVFAEVGQDVHIEGGSLADAINKGVSRVHIMDGRIPHGLLLEIFTNKGIGTAIIKENEEKYWNE